MIQGDDDVQEDPNTPVTPVLEEREDYSESDNSPLTDITNAPNRNEEVAKLVRFSR